MFLFMLYFCHGLRFDCSDIMLAVWKLNYIGIILIAVVFYYVRSHQTEPGKISNESTSYCYADDKDPYIYFSSKTPYQAIYNESKFEPPPENCKPVSIWLLVRHGIRYALRKGLLSFLQLQDEIRQTIVGNHEELKRGSLCKKDIENLKNWKWTKFPDDELDQLTPEGYVQILHLARRYKMRFPEVFEHEFSPERYQFKHTNHLKNRRTAIAFAEGIFGSYKIEENREKICPPAYTNDLLVRLYPPCKYDILDLNDDDFNLHSKTSFKETKTVIDMVTAVSERLGYTEPLPYKTVEDMYNFCRYMKAWHYDELSPWCAIFTKDELKILEYMNDLAYYYNSGPGLEVNKKFGCPLLQDMIYNFQRAIDNEESGDYFYGRTYFGHSTTLFNLLAQLGTHNDVEHITAYNYDTMQNRVWKTSLLDPFGSNFAAVLLRCDSGEPYQIMFYHNEMNFIFKECGGNICTWQKFYDLYKDTINPETCNTDYCEELDDDFWNWLRQYEHKKPESDNTNGDINTDNQNKSNLESPNDENTVNNNLQQHPDNDLNKTTEETYENNTKNENEDETEQNIFPHVIEETTSENNKNNNAKESQIIEEPENFIHQQQSASVNTDFIKTRSRLFVGTISKDNKSKTIQSHNTEDYDFDLELHLSLIIITSFIFICILYLCRRLFCRRKIYNKLFLIL